MKRQHETKAAHGSDTERAVAERRRLVWTLSIGFGVALILACLLVFVFNRPRPLTEEGRGVLATYERVRASLAADDLPTAQQAAGELASRFASRTPASRPSRRIATAPTLEAARVAFVELSQDAMRLARNQPGYFLARCPIQNCPEPCEGCPMSRYGPWVQVSAEVENPYMGRAHSRCGIIMP